MARGPNGQIKKRPKNTKKRPSTPIQKKLAREITHSVWQIETIRVNQEWKDQGMASIQLLQREEGHIESYRMVAFLVDLRGLGLKDAFIKANVSRRVFERIDQLRALNADASKMVSCSEDLMRRLVFGGLVWARQHGFHTPVEVLRITERVFGPVSDLEESDLSEFGYEGKPLLIGSLDGLMPFLGNLDETRAIRH